MIRRSDDDPLTAARESRRIEFKDQFSPSTPGAWCELIKDMVAIANSGGGSIVIGLDSSGDPSSWDPREFLAIDPADVVNQIAKYVSEQFADFAISEVSKSGKKLAMIRVNGRTGHPLVFERPGTYSVGKNQQKTAFARGSIYFRHGAKSEPSIWSRSSAIHSGGARPATQSVDEECPQGRSRPQGFRGHSCEPQGGS